VTKRNGQLMFQNCELACSEWRTRGELGVDRAGRLFLGRQCHFYPYWRLSLNTLQARSNREENDRYFHGELRVPTFSGSTNDDSPSLLTANAGAPRGLNQAAEATSRGSGQLIREILPLRGQGCVCTKGNLQGPQRDRPGGQRSWIKTRQLRLDLPTTLPPKA